uniref:Uncharacterized protein n=1 Tax=Panagrolaimus sp. JU765 TaxID=591449 RepID=A0AC34Q1A2_9BILA
MTYGKGARLYTFPNWSTAFGWMLSVIPLFFLPGFVFYNLRKFKQKGQDWKELFRLQPKWPSFDRHKEAGTGGTNTFYKTRVVPISDPNFSKHVNGGFNDGFNDDGSQQTKV